MDILKKLKIPKKDIRIVKLSIKDTKGLIKEYINDLHWDISEEKGTKSGYFKIIAQNPQTSIFELFLNNVPQLAVWQFYQDGKDTKIEFYFELFQHFRRWFYRVLVSMLLVMNVCGLIFAKHPTLVPFLVLLMILSLIMSFHFCMADRSKYQMFRENFYSAIFKVTGIREVVVQEGVKFPEANRYFLLMLISPIPFIIPVILDLLASLVSFLLVLVLTVSLLFCLSLVIFALTASYRPNLGMRAGLGLVGLQGGACLAIYCFFPIFNVLISPSSKNLGFFENAAVAIAIFAIALIMLFMVNNIYDTAGDLCTTIYKYKTYNPESEFSLVFKKDIYLRVFSISLLIIWLTLSLVNIFGIYFSISSLEYSFLGRNYLLGNKFVQSFSKDSPVLSRFFLIIYVIPILGILYVFIHKWIKEVAEITRSQKLHKIPGELNDKVRTICKYAGTNVPMLAIGKEDLFACNVKYIFPFGQVLKITDRTLKLLNGQELEALFAHEIYHLKEHTFGYSILETLSRCTLFGSGFLTLIQNSKEMEFKADDFSISYLTDRAITKSVFINALNKMVAANSFLKYIAPSNSLFSFIDHEAPIRKNDIDLKTKLKLLDEIYFGDLAISYVHPTIEERIKRIEAL